MTEFRKILSQYIPENAVDTIHKWNIKYNFQLKISKPRKTKLGDFKAINGVLPHRISVNNNLNKYVFLITLVHEIAHLLVWNKYRNKIKPHGREWKETFRILMDDFLYSDIFPEEIFTVLKNYLKNASASSYSDLELSRVLINYDKEKNTIFLENLEKNSFFRLSDRRTFKKLEKRRKRYRCICLENNKIYFIHPLINVIPIKN